MSRRAGDGNFITHMNQKLVHTLIARNLEIFERRTDFIIMDENSLNTKHCESGRMMW
jgi:hypothetical protein